MEGDLEYPAENCERNKGRYPRDGHSYCYRYNSYLRKVNKNVEHIHVEGKKGGLDSFVKRFISEYPEIIDWESGVHYSLNKNRRWNINENVHNMVECELDDFIGHETNIVIEVKSTTGTESEETCNFVLSNRDEVPVRTSSSKAHGQLKKDHSLVDGYMGIYVKNNNIYKSGLYNDAKYARRKKMRDKNKWAMCIDAERYDDTVAAVDDDYDDCGLEDHNDVQDSQIFQALELNKLILGKKRRQTHKKIRKSTIMNAEIETNKQKLKYYWDFFNSNVDNRTDNIINVQGQTNENLQQDSFLQYLPDLKRISLKLEVEEDTSLIDDWDMFKGNTFPRRLRLENKHHNIRILLEEKSKNDYNLSVSYDNTEATAEKIKDLEEILLDNFPLNLQKLSQCVIAMSDAKRVETPLRKDKLLILDTESMHKMMTQEREVEDCEMECPLSDSVCGICFTESDLSCQQSCGHSFCSSCWRFYTMTQVRGGASCVTCPAYLCDTQLCLTTVAWHGGAEILQQYKRWQVRMGVEQDSRYHWCPSPRCGRIVIMMDTPVHTVECRCGTAWCVSCKESGHWPASCRDYHDYRSYNKEIEKYNMLENTVEGRPCPKCGIIWEKLYGCNHMSCTQCGTHFCWGCGGEHSAASYCGGIRVPLESVRIVPLPTEKFSIARINNFQQYEAFKKLKLINPREKERIIHKFLAVNKEKYFEMMMMRNIEKSDDYCNIKNIVDISLTTMKTSKMLMTNNLLSDNYSTRVKTKFLLRAKPLLQQLTALLKHQKLSWKTVGRTIKDIEKINNELEKYNRRIARLLREQ